jgi:hypothetical protein
MAIRCIESLEILWNLQEVLCLLRQRIFRQFITEDSTLCFSDEHFGGT